MAGFLDEWIRRLREALRREAGAEAAERLLQPLPDVADTDDPRPLLEWTAALARRLQDELTARQLHDVMTSCACRYSRKRLERLRRIWADTGSIQAVIDEMWRIHRAGLREGMLLEEEIVRRLAELGWGVGGRIDESVITVTKIPRTANLRAYLSEDDGNSRRALYCHCPRLRRAAAEGVDVPASHCLCGAGFYRYIWETILERPVTVEVMETVCSGGDRCTFAVHLPEDVE
jgi:hypothetical protein